MEKGNEVEKSLWNTNFGKGLKCINSETRLQNGAFSF